MSKYTITIKNLLDNNFDFDLLNYPIFDENYRNTLNQNILYHYYESEIGLETPELFKFYLNQKMNEIMPYYNTLYKKQKTLIDNLENNVNLTETLDRKTDTNTSINSNSNSSGTSNNKNLFLDTPQGNTYKGTIDDTDYATNVTFDRNSNTNQINDSSTSSGDANENYIKTIIGNNGNKYNIEILQQVKDNLMNIDLMIINDLNDLFMGIY
jgi:hypothetical protein